MFTSSLADRILAALAETERDAQRPTVRAERLFSMLNAQLEDVRSELYALDTQGLVRFTPGFVAGDVVTLTAPGRVQLGMPAEPDAELEA